MSFCATRQRETGFALPSVLLASVVLLIVLTTALASAVASRNALNDQYYNQLARTAAESGAQMAIACITSNYQSVQWSNDTPLAPNTDCTGASINGSSPYLLELGTTNTSFSVGAPTMSGGIWTIETTARVDRVRTSNQAVWRSYSLNTRIQVAQPDLVSLDGGFDHSVGLTADRSTIYAWGRNSSGQLGNGTTTRLYTPQATISRTQLDGSFIKQVIGGFAHTLALTDNGNVYAWGMNTYGQLGVGDTTNRSIPTPVLTAGSPMQGKTIVYIGAGKYHSLAVDSEGVVYSWGRNDFGQLGDGTSTQRTRPIAVTTTGTPMAGKEIVLAKSNSNTHATVALTSDGSVYAWGDNTTLGAGRLGIGSTVTSVNTPHAVTIAGRIKDIETTTSATYFLLDDNRIFAAGANYTGQIVPTGSYSDVYRAPIEVPLSGTPLDGKIITQISGDGHHIFALTSEGRVYGWAWSQWGQSGTGTINTTGCRCTGYVAEVIKTGTPMQGKFITSISTGDRWVYAVASDGTAYSWGHNNDGQLGINSTDTIRSLPEQMIFIPRVTLY